MREDFHKVIVERPRWGSSLPSRKTGWSTSRYDPETDDDQPRRESFSWVWNSPCKGFSDRLGPLRRYLEKQVGRPWRKIEGEFLQALDVRTVIGRHLWDHALMFVELECRIGPGPQVLDLRGYPVRDLYVHPRTGLLLRVKPVRVDEAADRRRRIEEVTAVRLNCRTKAEKIQGLWFLITETGRTEERVEVHWDAVGRKILHRVRRPLLLKKQANKEEIRRILRVREATIK